MRELKPAVVISAITALGFVLRAWGLPSQPLTSDDMAVALSAQNYIETGHLGPVMWNHPVLRNIIVYMTLKLAGGGVWGLKAASLMFGTLSIPLLYIAGRRILENETAALVGAFLLCIDPMHISFSRQAVHEVWMMFFILSGLVLTLEAIDRQRPLYLGLAGLAFGLGVASKWDVAVYMALCVIYAIQSRKREDRFDTESAAWDIGALVIVPSAVYLLTYMPWFGRGYGLGDWAFLHSSMWRATVFHEGYNEYMMELDHNASLWFIKPVGYATIAFTEAEPVALVSISNPLTWMLVLPAVAWMGIRSLALRSTKMALATACFVFGYMPFAFTSRPIWAHSAFSILPFGFMAVGMASVSLKERLKHGRWIFASYLVLASLIACALYMLAIGKGMDYEALRPLVMRFQPMGER